MSMLLLLLLLVVVTVWKLFQVARYPKDAPLRSVTLCLLTLVASYPFAMPDEGAGAVLSADHGTAKILQNVLLLGAAYFLMCFYLYSADEKAGGRRARKEAVVPVAVAVLLIVNLVTTSHEVFVGSFSTADMTIPQVAFFYGLAGAYLTYALAIAGRWTCWYARRSSRPHYIGLWVTAIGLSGMALASAVRVVIVLIRHGGGHVPHPVMSGVASFLAMANLLLLVGIGYSVVRTRITSSLLWLRHRRDHRRLAPLWQLLAEVYPDNVLRGAEDQHGEKRANRVHRRYFRRVVECRDGLVDISPYLVGEGDEGPLLDLDPAELATRLHRAAKRVEKDEPEPRRVVPLAMSPGDDPDSDVRQLIAISQALSTQPT